MVKKKFLFVIKHIRITNLLDVMGSLLIFLLKDIKICFCTSHLYCIFIKKKLPTSQRLAISCLPKGDEPRQF